MADAVWLIESGRFRWFTEDESRVLHWSNVIGAKVTRYVKESSDDEATTESSRDAGSSVGAERGQVVRAEVPRSLADEALPSDSVVRIL